MPTSACSPMLRGCRRRLASCRVRHCRANIQPQCERSHAALEYAPEIRRCRRGERQPCVGIRTALQRTVARRPCLGSSREEYNCASIVLALAVTVIGDPAKLQMQVHSIVTIARNRGDPNVMGQREFSS